MQGIELEPEQVVVAQAEELAQQGLDSPGEATAADYSTCLSPVDGNNSIRS
jgi:hypothetical protein